MIKNIATFGAEAAVDKVTEIVEDRIKDTFTDEQKEEYQYLDRQMNIGTWLVIGSVVGCLIISICSIWIMFAGLPLWILPINMIMMYVCVSKSIQFKFKASKAYFSFLSTIGSNIAEAAKVAKEDVYKAVSKA